MSRSAGWVAAITGGGAGIGVEYARALLGEGADLALIDRDGDLVAETDAARQRSVAPAARRERRRDRQRDPRVPAAAERLARRGRRQSGIDGRAPADVHLRDLEAGGAGSDRGPRDLVGPLLFLCSDESAFITGETICPSGGYALQV
jgi:NAD(P)-dependent dehydrogenase (short-subunit alcohol dehydrogenase family)